MSDAKPLALSVSLPIDPATLSTAQQKVLNFRTRMVITNPRVAKAMRVVCAAAKPLAHLAERVRKSAETDALHLSLSFYFAYPKSMLDTRAKRAEACEGKPVTSARYGDLDNRAKAFIDALVQARWMPDDHYITELYLSKQYTLGRPCVLVLFAPSGGHDYEWIVVGNDGKVLK